MRKGLISEVVDFFSVGNRYSYDFQRAFAKFCKKDILYDKNFNNNLPDDQLKIFIDWFLFEYKLKMNNQRPIRFFYLTNYLSFSDEDRKNYKNLLRSKYSFWKICKIDFDKGMELEDMFGQKHIYVKEVLGTHGTAVGDIINNRISKIDDHYELLGNNDWVWAKEDYDHPVLCELLKYKKADPKLTRDLMTQFFRTSKLMEKGGSEKIQQQIINKDECICSLCHKQGVIGALKFDPLTDEPHLYCKKCASKFVNYNN